MPTTGIVSESNPIEKNNAKKKIYIYIYRERERERKREREGGVPLTLMRT